MPLPDNPERIRAFVAISVPERLLDKMKTEQDRLDARMGGQSRDAVRWTQREQLHLTLKFYGNVQTGELDTLRQALHRAATGVGALELGLAGLGCFPSASRPSVIWLGLEGAVSTLQVLQGQVERETAAFGSHSETRAFHPHLTIGRVKADGAQARRIGEVIRSETVGNLGTWEVNEIALVRSQLSPRGSTYTCLARFALAA